MDKTERARKLLDRAAGYLGMMREVEAKALLLKEKLRRARATGEDLEAVEGDAARQAEQMRHDLAKYSRRLHKIYEELQGYGLIS